MRMTIGCGKNVKFSVISLKRYILRLSKIFLVKGSHKSCAPTLASYQTNLEKIIKIPNITRVLENSKNVFLPFLTVSTSEDTFAT